MGPRAVVVLDTNVLVSALGGSGAERRIYSHCRAGVLRLITSPPLLEELHRVLRYPKLRLREQEAEAFERDYGKRYEHIEIVTARRALTEFALE